MTPVRLGFIGFGIMGERLMRAAVKHDRDTVVVSGAYDPSPLTADRLKAIDSGVVAFDSADAVIAASDCLHIATPPASHLEYLSRCFAAGRAALGEKPLATDQVTATAAVSALTRGGARVGVNFPFASSIAVDQLDRWIREGAIGTPQRIDIDLAFATWPRSWQMDAVRWLDGPNEGGFTREVGSHFLFLSRRLFGSLKLLSAACEYPDLGLSERNMQASLVAGAVPVRFSGSVGTTTNDDHNTWTLIGDRGQIRLRDWSIAERSVDGVWQVPAGTSGNAKSRTLVLVRQLDKIAAMTRGKTTNLATLNEALDVQICVEVMLRSR